MYLKEFENVEVILKHYTQPSRWEKTLGFKPVLNRSYFIHWSLLKTKKDYRRKFIKIKCDDCSEVFERKIRNLDSDNNYHLCSECMNKGERNGMYGIEKSENQKLAHQKWLKDNGNPFTWDSVKKIIKEKEKETTKKRLIKVIGQKRSEETKLKMSLSSLRSFKEGRSKPNTGWGKITIRQYNGIDYQSTYELNFLKYLESINKFHLIERGPRISYIDLDEKEHNYFIDYRIKNTDIVFEIKSTYVWNKHITTNQNKQKYAEKLYDYYIVMDNKFEIISEIFKNYE